MLPSTHADRDQFLTEDIHYPNRCQIDGCNDDIIPDPNGIEQHCFKHQLDLDL